MVEGPKVVLKVQRIQCLKGQSLESMTVMPTSSSSQALTGAMLTCIGMIVQSVWCLGKELFIVMGPREGDNEFPPQPVVGIRLHFGMAGSERLIQTSTLLPGYHLQNLHIVAKQMLPKQCRKKWTSCLIFNDQALFVYDSTLSTRACNYLDKAFLSLERDVMSFDKFSMESVLNYIRNSDQSRSIHEVIMDQSVLPGVGNVIKIEGLFDSGMHPHCVTSEIDDVWLMLLIRKLRDYARYWYDCCKGPGANKQNRKNVYGRPNCGTCNSGISLIRDGVLQRITYLCSSCQLFPVQHYKLVKLKLERKEKQLSHPQETFFAPGKGKISLEVKGNYTANNNDNNCNCNSDNNNNNNDKSINNIINNNNPARHPDWSCSYCTLDNKFDLSVCEICGTARTTQEICYSKEHSKENYSMERYSIPNTIPAAYPSQLYSIENCMSSADIFSSTLSSPALVYGNLEGSCVYSEANNLHQDNRVKDGSSSCAVQNNFTNTISSVATTVNNGPNSYLIDQHNVGNNDENRDNSINRNVYYERSYHKSNNSEDDDENNDKNDDKNNIQQIGPTPDPKPEYPQKQPPVDKDISGSGHSFIHPQNCKCMKQSTLHRVRKSGPTSSRLFWSCSGRKCDFFSWADSLFPKCQHGCVSTVRRVLKPGPTNGQYFFSCSQGTKCGFFLWTTAHCSKPTHPTQPIQATQPTQATHAKQSLKVVGGVRVGGEVGGAGGMGGIGVGIGGQADTLKRHSNPDSSNNIPMKKFKFVTIPL